ncbi:hypothetical protein [Mycobacterium sp. 1465703.0]|uniref:hypothetical protein n=1 Tax=Mycobacterium sp. 1465703.0 TaxID=1834078 RepID=UPI000B2D0DBA|nr:hypothetical protein [Mycobacterium sp. 1465703.0]
MTEHSPVHIDVPHRDGCNNQLVVIGGDYLRRHRGMDDVVYRDSRGRRHRHAWRLWLVLICNDISCPAVVLVRADAIEKFATETLINEAAAAAARKALGA